MQKVNACSQEKALGVELEDELRLLTTIVRAHEETCEFTKDKVIGLVEKARSQQNYSQCQLVSNCPLNPAPHILENGASSQYMEEFSERFAPAIRGVVEFAKRIPGFGFLSQDDQVTLLKAGVFEVLLVRLACMFDSQAKTLVCLNGQMLRRDSLHTASNARFLLDSMFDFAERLNTLHLSDSEVGLFCSVVVIAADRPGLRNIDLVTKIQKKLADILKKSVSANHPENPNIFEHLMKKIPDLRTLNTLHSEKLLAYKMEPNGDGQTVVNAIEGHIQVTSMATPNYSAIPPEYWSQYNHLISSSSPHPPCLAPEEDLRSASPGQHSQHSGTSSEWSTTDSTKDEHDLVGSPRSVGSSGHDQVGSPRSIGSSGLCIDDVVKSPIRSASFSSSRGYVNEEGWPADLNQSVAEYHHHHHHHGLPKRVVVVENPGSEHGSSSGDEGYFVDSPIKGLPVYPKLRRVDSPTDSGIESGKEHGPSTTPTISVCSSPQSSVDEKVKDVMEHDHQHKQHESIEDMPVLKRALQAPPIINPHMLMDEAYRHHKKFRAARREAENPASPSSQQQQHMSLASTHSTLVRTLEQAPRYLSEQQLKRTDLIHNIIMQKETQNQPPIQQQQQQQTLSQSHHHDASNHYVFSGHQNSNNSNGHTYTGTQQQHKNLLVCQNNGQYYNAPPASWPFAQRQSPSPQQQYEQNSCPHPQQQNFSRSASPQRLVYTAASRSPTTSPLVMNGDHHLHHSSKPSGEAASQPLNLSKKLFTPPPMLKMES